MEITALEFIAICLCWFCCGIAVNGCIDERRKRSTKEEVTIDGWVARNNDGDINCYPYFPPDRLDEHKWVSDPNQFNLDYRKFPSVTWESEPKKVSVTIKAE